MANIIKFTNLDDLIRRYQVGESELKLAREFSVSRNVIRRRLIQAGITPRNSSQANIVSMGLMTPEQRQSRAAASHLATKGRYQTIRERTQRAKTRQIRKLGTSVIEDIFTNSLTDKGLNVTQQKAIGMYNVDIAIESTRIAVEIFGGNWHSSPHHTNLLRKRLPYILNHGWHLVIIWVDSRNHPLTIQATDYILSFMQELSLNKTIGSQYRMIWGDGKPMAIDSSHFKGFAFIAGLCDSL